MKLTHRPRIPVPPPPKKPILLMNLGVGWSATSPFLYTLTIDQRYCHPGHIKENHYLRILFDDAIKRSDDIRQFILNTSVNETHWLFRGWQKELYEYNYHFLDDPNYVRNWYQDVSIEKYIEYYLKHWNVIKSDFHAVADFSNHNWALPYYTKKNIHYGEEMIEKIQEVFDLKVTVQFRDPIRRLYSELGTCFDDQIPDTIAKNKKLDEDIIINKEHNNFFRLCLDNERWDGANCHYADLYTKWENLVGKDNILYIIMEEFWDPAYRKQQCERLSNFLDAPIQKIHENAYFPDRGADAPHYLKLNDQWTSDKETITEENIQYAQIIMRSCYTGFKEKFGYIPEMWSQL